MSPAASGKAPKAICRPCCARSAEELDGGAAAGDGDATWGPMRPAAARPPGRRAVRMSCYAGGYSGTLAASEPRSTSWPGSATPTGPGARCRPALFDDLKAAGQLR